MRKKSRRRRRRRARLRGLHAIETAEQPVAGVQPRAVVPVPEDEIAALMRRKFERVGQHPTFVEPADSQHRIVYALSARQYLATLARLDDVVAQESAEVFNVRVDRRLVNRPGRVLRHRIRRQRLLVAERTIADYIGNGDGKSAADRWN
jgi:hypothetical protein